MYNVYIGIIQCDHLYEHLYKHHRNPARKGVRNGLRKGVYKDHAGHATMAALSAIIVTVFVKCVRIRIPWGAAATRL